jgi:hypothetical protein
VTSDNGLTTSIIPPDVLDISDYQSTKIFFDYQTHNQSYNRQKFLSLVWQKCTESMHAKVKVHRDYQGIEEELNGIELLRVIKLICLNIEDEKYAPHKLHDIKAAFYALNQGMDSDQAYQIKFMNTVHVIEQGGASLGEDPLTLTSVCTHLGFHANTTITTEMAKITKKVMEYTLGTAMILGADPDRYSSIIRGLNNISLAGRDEWSRPSRNPTTTFPSGKGMAQMLVRPVISRALISLMTQGIHNLTEGSHKLRMQK